MKIDRVSCSKNISKFIFLAFVLAHSNVFTSQDDQTQFVKNSENNIVSGNCDKSSDKEFVRPVALSDIINGFYQGGKHLKNSGYAAGQTFYEKLIKAKNAIEAHVVIMADQIVQDQARRKEMAESVQKALQNRMVELQKNKETELLIEQSLEKTEELLSDENFSFENTPSENLEQKDLPQLNDLKSEDQDLFKAKNQKVADTLQHPENKSLESENQFLPSEIAKPEIMDLTYVALASAGIVGISFLTYKAYQYWIVSHANPNKMIKNAIKNCLEDEVLKSIKIVEKWTGLSLTVGKKQALSKSRFSYLISKIDKVRSVKHKKLLYAQVLLMIELSEKSSRVIIAKMALL
ncbi:MAG: hypothetical protein NTU89_04170 [Candidatus Dependentiae bacterium]|nr:hypothetical protein [Candidatus Dependentiae bacterium]